MSDERWRPRWWLLGNFGVIVVVHLVASGGWTTTTTVMAPISLALTLVFVFVRRLPWWLTGDLRDLRNGRRVLRAAGIVGLLLVDAVIVAALVVHPPHGDDVRNAGMVVAIFFGATGAGVYWLLPKRPVTPRSALRRRFRTATALMWATAVFTLGAEVAVIVAVGGWLPWVLPVVGVVAVLAIAGWRSDLGVAARCLASDSWTPVTAAAFDVRPGEPVNGWAVLPGDVRIRLHLPAVPADIAAELAGRRLWLAGWPSEYLVTGLPEGSSYAVGLIGAHRRGGKKTVTPEPAASVSSPS
ncbi:hypothetical protein DMA12_20240 [Amycolatopsis balhimycina DSM 5908]|uniref:Uncharacterized protein n=1 Tax=Amycolatopsis balhimycina DSM 5908 TaxID=1081091 RepID=A0A428WIP8_AMYBA|nr:hypothetical protein [Amycolatopsis balhimycina]RSM42974.1 hypothetical protein DMA12_20240 [Amycolatopsis balhimycina DSM 5908]